MEDLSIIELLYLMQINVPDFYLNLYFLIEKPSRYVYTNEYKISHAFIQL